MRSLLKICNILILASAIQVHAYDFIVDPCGKGDHRTIQEAIDAVPDFRKLRTTIYIRNGIYREKLILGSGNSNRDCPHIKLLDLFWISRIFILF